MIFFSSSWVASVLPTGHSSAGRLEGPIVTITIILMIFIITIAIILLIFIINLWIQLHHQDHPQMIIFLMARCWQWKREEISRCHVCWPVLAILRSYYNINCYYHNIIVYFIILLFNIKYQIMLKFSSQRQFSLPMSSHYHLFLDLHLSPLYGSFTIPWWSQSWPSDKNVR